MKRRRVKQKRISLLTDMGIALLFIIAIFLVSKVTNVFIKYKSNVKEQSKYQTPNDIFTKEDTSRVNQNKAIVKEIQEKYKIEVAYGEATRENVASLNATPILEENTIYNNLVNLKATLEKYPEGFFNEFKNESHNYSVSIFLVDKFDSRNVALATRNTNNEFKIYISNEENFEKVLHHELYHIIEYYIKLEYDIEKVYEKWQEYNPVNYTYPESVKNLDDKYIHVEGMKNDDVYFVSKYAKTNDKEDRAETFSDMMYRDTKMYYYGKDKPVYKKAYLITKVLDDSFETVKEENTEMWERFIK